VESELINTVSPSDPLESELTYRWSNTHLQSQVRSKSDLDTKRKLKRIQYSPELIDDCFTETGLIMTAT